MQPITVVIAHQDSAVRAACERLLRNEPGIVVTATTGSDVAAAVASLQPHIVLAGLTLMCPDQECAMLLSLRRTCQATCVVLLTDCAFPEDRLMYALAIGACGYLEYGNVERHLAKAMHNVGRGGAWVPRKMLGRLLGVAF